MKQNKAEKLLAGVLSPIAFGINIRVKIWMCFVE